MTVAPDAKPDDSVLRVQVLAAARPGSAKALDDVLDALAKEVARDIDRRGTVRVLRPTDDDTFGLHPAGPPFGGVVQVQCDRAIGLDALLDALGGVPATLADAGDVARSAVLVGAPQFLIPAEPTALQFEAYMGRKAELTHEQYIDHYFHIHANFAFRMTHIRGYTQFHVDPDASAVAAQRLGVGPRGFDSVTELYIDSMDVFTHEEDSAAAGEAMVDEQLFVSHEFEDTTAMCCTGQDVSA